MKMKTTMMILALFACATAFSAPGADTTAQQKEKEDPAVRAARIREKKRVFLGDIVRKPGSMKGSISILSAQDTVSLSDIESGVDMLRQTGKYDFRVGKVAAAGPWTFEAFAKARAEHGTDVTIFFVEDDAAPATLVAPEDRWAAINVSKLSKGLPESAVLRKRMLAVRARREFVRTFVLACGGGASQFPGNMMDAAKLEDLDTVEEFIPVDIPPRYTAYLEKIGVTPAYDKAYYFACKEGWAPQPTNDIQQAIWNRVKERKERGPTNPITIQPPGASVK